MSDLRGQLLVAAPTLVDPNFRRTVVLVCAHGEEGALGIVLNRRGDVTVAEAVPDLSGVMDEEAVMFLGGPVQPTGVVVLAEWLEPESSAGLVLGDIGLLGAGEGAGAVAARARRARAYAGFAGWGPGQLDAELATEDWILVPGEPDDVFARDPDALWSAVLARQGGELALLARMPEDPRVN